MSALAAHHSPARRRRIHRKALVGYFRQLCLSGIDSRLLAPHLIETARELIGADWGAMFWPDDGYRISGMYSEQNLQYALANTYAEMLERNPRAELDAYGVDFELAMRRGRGWQNFARCAHLRGSEYFEALYRPLHALHGIEATACAEARGWSTMMLYRAELEFDVEADRKLAALAPYVAHCVRAVAIDWRELTSLVDSGALIVDRTGRILHDSGSGLRLLLLSSDTRFSGARIARDRLPEFMTPLLEALWADATSETRIPILERWNLWGRFVSRGYLMNALERETPPLAVIHIEREEPRRLRVLRGAQEAGLSARQSELCIYLCRGHSNAEIAQCMHIRTSTVVDHLRKMFDRLNVHDRAELIRVLSKPHHA